MTNEELKEAYRNGWINGLAKLRKKLLKTLQRTPLGEWGDGYWHGKKWSIELIDKIIGEDDD